MGVIYILIEVNPMESSLKENYFLASCWLLLSFIVLVATCYSINTPGKYLIPSGLGISAILFFMARQRLSKYSMKPSAFIKNVKNLGLFIALYSGATITVVSNI